MLWYKIAAEQAQPYTESNWPQGAPEGPLGWLKKKFVPDEQPWVKFAPNNNMLSTEEWAAAINALRGHTLGQPGSAQGQKVKTVTDALETQVATQEQAGEINDAEHMRIYMTGLFNNAGLPSELSDLLGSDVAAKVMQARTMQEPQEPQQPNLVPKPESGPAGSL